MDHISEEVERRKFELNKVISKTEKQLKRAPAGRLRVSGGKFYQLTQKGDTSGKYIPKDKVRLISALAQKDYDMQVLALARRELESLDSGRLYKGTRFEDVYGCLHEIRKGLVVPARLPDEMFVEKWLARPYEKMGFDENAPGYFTDSRIRVRSKSELIIANRFEKYHIPFLYEVPVYINGIAFRPDFLVLKMPERKEFYWEHLGMLGSADYSDKNVRKIDVYSEGGIILADNLIITLETGNVPLSTDNIDKIIKRVLLP